MKRVYTYKGTVAGLAQAMAGYQPERKLSPFVTQVANFTGAACAVLITIALASL